MTRDGRAAAGGRLVVGEFLIDPDFVTASHLRTIATAAGFTFQRQLGPALAYYARFTRDQ